MSAPIEMLIATYANPGEAEKTLEELRALHASGDLYLIDALVLSKERDGDTKVKEIDDPRAKQGRRFGAVVGGMIGMILGPKGSIFGAAAGAAIGAASGAVTGGVAAEAIDSGESNRLLDSIVERLPNRTSALVIVIQEQWVEKAREILDAYKSDIYEYDVSLSVFKQVDE